MSNIDTYADLSRLKDNLKAACTDIEDEEVRKSYSLDIEDLINTITFEMHELETEIREEKRQEDKEREREYRGMVGI